VMRLDRLVGATCGMGLLEPFLCSPPNTTMVSNVSSHNGRQSRLSHLSERPLVISWTLRVTALAEVGRP